MERYALSIGIILQARMGSTRLPGKVLKKIGARTLLENIVSRVGTLQNKATFVIATTDLQQDNKIADFCKQNNLSCFRGSELNVLDRYYECATLYKFQHIVRLTGDNPFIDIEELDNLINLHLENQSDYSRSLGALPKGVGSEIFTYNSLEVSFFNGLKENHKEHVNEYIEENEKLFKISELTVAKTKNRPDVGLTVDTLDDYRKACFIVQNSVDPISTEQAIELCLQYV